MVDTGSVDAMVSVHAREGHFRDVEGSDMFTTNRHAHALASYERQQMIAQDTFNFCVCFWRLEAEPYRGSPVCRRQLAKQHPKRSRL
jgi:hypothetical protein